MRLLGLLRTKASLFWIILVAAVLFLQWGCMAMAAESPWDQPATALAEQIAGALGPGQAQLTLRNLSTIANDDLPAIRRLIERDLKAHGIVVGNDESANTVRITLSEDLRERLWVAEIVEGSGTKVVMARAPLEVHATPVAASGMTLHLEKIVATQEPVLAALETPGGLVTVEAENMVLYARSADGWHEVKRASISRKRGLTRDPRAMLRFDGQGLEAWLPGVQCEVRAVADWSVDCRESDDPWPIPGNATMTAAAIPGTTPTPAKAFYNITRDYFTGIVAPNPGVDLPPFYSAARIPRVLGQTALLIDGLDGKVMIAENGVLKAVNGTRDWGSDLALISSGCGTGTQIVVSGSGEQASDSLRAYELPAQEAIPASAPLTMNGTVIALSGDSDGKSLLAAVQTMSTAGQPNRYEVDRVTATCN